jgi:membrane fusion protein, multidrug efflux system
MKRACSLNAITDENLTCGFHPSLILNYLRMKTKAIIILLAVFVAACGGGDKQAKLAKLKKEREALNEKITVLENEIAGNKKGIDSSRIILVSVIDIQAQVFNHFVEVQGRLDGDENIAVTPKMAGVVLQKFADVGANVTKGQVLAQLDDAAIQEQIQGVQAQVNLARETYTKQKALWDQNIGSEIAYLQAKTGKESAEKNLNALLEQAEMYKIKAPISGTIAEASFKVGQMVSPQLPTPAYRIVSFKNLKVVAEVAEAYASKIQKGDKVSIFFPDLNREILANVTFASEYINPVNRTFIVEVRLPIVDNNLKANMIAVLKINDYKASNATAIPINYVLNDNKGAYVYVASVSGNNKISTKRYVKLGMVYNGIVEIKDGLKTGDNLISGGYQSVEEGTPIAF